jgi:hypothetical protein
MLCEKTKEGTAQTTAGKCFRKSKEQGIHCGDITKGTNVHESKTNKKWSTALTVSVFNKIAPF